MNSFDSNKLIRRFQDLITQDKMPALRTFKREIHLNFVIFSKGDLENFFEFITGVRNHQDKNVLAFALEPMFKMLVNSMIDKDEVVYVFNKKEHKNYFIQLGDICTHFRRKRIEDDGYKCFIIPYTKQEWSVTTEEGGSGLEYLRNQRDPAYEKFLNFEFLPRRFGLIEEDSESEPEDLPEGW